MNIAKPNKTLVTACRFAMLCLHFHLSACVSVPDGITPVNDFEVNRYLGKWYEIARLDHRFERGMQKVTANYTLKDNGGIAVVNRGFLTNKQRWKQATGNARLVDKKDQGHLKVSFFGPFYGSYVVFELDHEHYQYAFVTSTSRNYLWFLSRTPSVSDELMEHFRSTAARIGFDTDKLIVVEH